ncbi:acyltransferase ChoActase/COT/CPT [Chytridium lagenaria]|nr:acyltransferase ChoActase/COT/CPT [Chytridium lagenaria]
MGNRIGELEKSVTELVSEAALDEDTTFENQDKVLRLPIPPLKQTAEKYLKSCKPLLSSEDFAKTTAAVNEFVKEGGYGEVLQSRLAEVDKSAPNSWLEDIWLKKAYLEWREPSMINLLATPPPKGEITEFQIQRASGFIHRLLEYKKLSMRRNSSEQLEPELMKDKPLCMNQYKFQFGTTRMPGEFSDVIYNTFPATAKHIVVLFKDQLYTLEVYGSNGEILRLPPSPSTSLELIVADAKGSAPQPPVGVLTAGHRDTWLGFEKIKTSLFAVCIEDYSISGNVDDTHQQIFHNFNAHNRWFDKSIQVVVLTNGRAGVNGEHTPSDAVIPGNIMNFIVGGEKNAEPVEFKNASASKFEKIEWAVDGNDTESVLLHTDVYGSRFIKDKAKASPDAFVQLAMQITGGSSPRAYGYLRHGRTETGRSLTEDTWRFASEFDSAPKEKVLELFRAAIKSQSDYMKDATFGKGIDRHLLGLRTLIKDGEKEKATLFNDPAYIKSMYFKLSTSNMSPGYGINYAIGKENLKFSISAKKSCADTKTREVQRYSSTNTEGLG